MRPLLLLDPHNYVRCLHCDRVFIPTYISAATATVRCPCCNVSSRLPSIHPPPPPPPAPIDIEDDDFGEDLESYSDEDEDDFDTTVDWTAEADQYEPNPAPAATSFIKSLNSEKCAVNFGVLKQAPSCAICSDDFKLEDSVNQMPCDHWFHSDCVVTWLKRKNNCPLCRHEFPLEPNQDHMLQSPATENPTAATRLENSSVRQGQGITLIVELRINRRPADM